MAGKLVGVSVGPGDPELLTLAAVRAIREADVVAVPDSGSGRQTAREIASPYLGGKPLLECPTPMSHDRADAKSAYRETAERICERLDAGETVAYLCLGDISVYSSYLYVHDLVAARGHECEIVPGVTSFSAAAARLGISLCEGRERLLVSPGSAGDLDVDLGAPVTRVFMKAGSSLEELTRALAARGLAERASLVENCGMPGERVITHLSDADGGGEPGYFSVVIVK